MGEFMNKESVNRAIIATMRKSLRTLDLLNINDQKLYIKYYQFILKRLNKVLELTWEQYQAMPQQDFTNPTENIWVMWWQGYDEAPKIIQSNIDNLYQIFGNKVKLITKDNYSNYTDIDKIIRNRFNNNNISFTQWSDIVRYNLLKNNGGLWIDSSVVVSNIFLDIPELFTTDFFSLCSTANIYKFISLGRWTGWFIGGKKEYCLFQFMDIFFKNYYRYYEKTIDYFFADDAAAYFYNKEAKFREDVEHLAKVWDPYLFIRNFKSVDVEKIMNQFKTKQKYCVQKVTYKFDFDNVDNNSLAKKLELGER